MSHFLISKGFQQTPKVQYSRTVGVHEYMGLFLEVLLGFGSMTLRLDLTRFDLARLTLQSLRQQLFH